MNKEWKYDKINGTKLYDNFRATLYNGNIIYALESDIKVSEIDNIDNYNFIDYWVYSSILIVILMLFYLKPYFYVWKRNIRFYIQNKQFEKQKSIEVDDKKSSKGKISTK